MDRMQFTPATELQIATLQLNIATISLMAGELASLITKITDDPEVVHTADQINALLTEMGHSVAAAAVQS